MTPEQRIAYIQSQIACALIELEAMKAENLARIFDMKAQAYTEKDFMALIDKYYLHHNGVMSELFGR